MYRTGLIRDVRGTNQLAYEVEVTNGSSVRDFVFVHAHAGKILNRYSTVNDALFRRLFEISTATQVWQEGDAFPGTLNQDQQNIVTASGHAYYLFSNAFGRDSYDGAGAEMQSVNNDPTIACPNANWNGATTNYCNGVTADDVVAHEWGHAYTQFTHDLIYQWQSGALNESYSDIWGETVDQINGYGTDTPDADRLEGGCTSHAVLRDYVIINSPGSIAGFCNAGAADFGPPLDATGVTGDVVLGDDGVAPTSDGCEPFVNGAAVSGNIALVDRGTCGFTVKVANAQAAGATGVLVADNVWGPPVALAGVDPTITIPSVRIALQSGNVIKGELAGGVNVTMRLGLPSTEDNVRWLMGEDATAFGGAIRDMWNPTVRQRPGQGDRRRVLLRDATTAAACTPTRACRTTDTPCSSRAAPTTAHTDRGDRSRQGRAPLLPGHDGVPDPDDQLRRPRGRARGVVQRPRGRGGDLQGLSTSQTPAGPSGESMTADDCAQVAEMIAAVELRTDPTEQCDFQPVLQPGEPPVCAGDSTTVFEEDFEDGLGGWTLTNEGLFAGWPNIDWVHDTTLPAGRAGAAAQGDDPDEGNCDLGAGDISGVHASREPGHRDPGGAGRHAAHVRSLRGDGGPIRRREREDQHRRRTVHARAGRRLHVQSRTTRSCRRPTRSRVSPGSAAPTEACSRARGGSPRSISRRWASTGGQTIRVRFDMGMDGCAGIDGWYVDDVTVVVCALVAPRRSRSRAASRPTRTTSGR